MSTTLRPPHCSRGKLLAAHRHEVWRASKYLGTHGLSGGGMLIIEESRGRITRELMRRWTARLVVPHMALLLKIFATVEAIELYR